MIKDRIEAGITESGDQEAGNQQNRIPGKI